MEQNLDQRFDTLLEDMKKKGYDKMTYKPDEKLEISGEFFIALTNYVAYTRSVLNTFEEAFKRMGGAIEAALDNTSVATFKIMENHAEYCKDGKTISNQEMDKLDAKKKIKVEKK